MKGGVSQGTRLRVLLVSEGLGEGETCILPPAPMFCFCRENQKKKKLILWRFSSLGIQNVHKEWVHIGKAT